MIGLTPADAFGVGIIAGIALALAGLGVIVLVEEIRTATRASPTTPDVEALDVDDCDGCSAPLNDDNTANTCGVHRLCLDCTSDPLFWSCTGCRHARHQATDSDDEVYDWATTGGIR